MRRRGMVLPEFRVAWRAQTLHARWHLDSGAALMVQWACCLFSFPICRWKNDPAWAEHLRDIGETEAWTGEEEMGWKQTHPRWKAGSKTTSLGPSAPEALEPAG